jgi:hypothetical protein
MTIVSNKNIDFIISMFEYINLTIIIVKKILYNIYIF